MIPRSIGFLYNMLVYPTLFFSDLELANYIYEMVEEFFWLYIGCHIDGWYGVILLEGHIKWNIAKA